MIFDSILIFLCGLSFLFNIMLFLKLYQYSLIILDMEDAVEESLDVLDKKYGRMYEILQKPVFFDSVEIRQVLGDIRECQNSLLAIANKITKNIGNEGGESKEENS